jgi:hypothetical protein
MPPPAWLRTVGGTSDRRRISQRNDRSGIFASTKICSPSGTSSSCIQIFLKHGPDGCDIGRNETEGLARHTRLLAIWTPFALVLWYRDFYLCPVWHREGFLKDDDIPLGVSFIPHSCLSPVDVSTCGASAVMREFNILQTTHNHTHWRPETRQRAKPCSNTRVACSRSS